MQDVFGAKYVSLHVRVTNKGAHHLYTRSLGYKCVGAPRPLPPDPILVLLFSSGVLPFLLDFRLCRHINASHHAVHLSAAPCRFVPGIVRAGCHNMCTRPTPWTKH